MKVNKHSYCFGNLFYLAFFLSFCSQSQENSRPKGFEEIQTKIPSVVLEIRYFGTHNFIGKRIDGYHRPVAIISKEALEQLKKVQEDLNKLNLGLKIFDAYRPQNAVDHFMRWAKDKNDTLSKTEFYPDVAKKDLFKMEYIAEKSGHTRGSTLDVTLIELESGKELDMGSPYDYFGKISWPFDTSVSDLQRKNRLLLRKLMIENGFKPYQFEWWHFTLKEEPYPNTYFNFPVD